LDRFYPVQISCSGEIITNSKPNLDKNILKIYTNPESEYLFIKGIKTLEISKIYIIDVLGKKIPALLNNNQVLIKELNDGI